jgi:hypothetical protein
MDRGRNGVRGAHAGTELREDREWNAPHVREEGRQAAPAVLPADRRRVSPDRSQGRRRARQGRPEDRAQVPRPADPAGRRLRAGAHAGGADRSHRERLHHRRREPRSPELWRPARRRPERGGRAGSEMSRRRVEGRALADQLRAEAAVLVHPKGVDGKALRHLRRRVEARRARGQDGAQDHDPLPDGAREPRRARRRRRAAWSRRRTGTLRRSRSTAARGRRFRSLRAVSPFR